MGNPSDPRWSTAYHEAGHCVAGLALGEAPTRSSIVAGDNFEGWTGFEDEDIGALLVDDPPREAAEAYIIRCFAGPRAEGRHTGEHASASACDDYEQAAEFLLRLTADPDGLNAALEARTEAILDEHWPAIERVATALVEHLSLDGEAIRKAARIKGGAP